VIDARKLGFMKDRVLRDFAPDDIEKIAGTFRAWRAFPNSEYADIAGFCKSATLQDIATHSHALTPGRYVGAEDIEDDGEPFEEKMANLTSELGAQFAESAKLEQAIAANLKALGYELEIQDPQP
jgi:type I restriction enzyme M protein